MDYMYMDYTITQSGRDLTSESSIRVQKNENKVTRLIFEIEDWLKEFRLYLAFYCPETSNFHYEPLLKNSDGVYYFIIGTRISYYPGKVRMILVGIDPAYELDDNVLIDTTNTVYISKEFVRIVVLNNFIDDSAFELSMPTLDQKLDDFVVMHENVAILYDQIAQDVITVNENAGMSQQAKEDAEAALEQCHETLTRCQTTYDEMETRYQALINQMLAQYQTYLQQLETAYNQYLEDLRNERGEQP